LTAGSPSSVTGRVRGLEKLHKTIRRIKAEFYSLLAFFSSDMYRSGFTPLGQGGIFTPHPQITFDVTFRAEILLGAILAVYGMLERAL